ncbi:serine/threonine-protein kinase [Roseospira navarrensis]|uniref:non-specific serine/threonine protein kinase n=1 Tax=Roseospira navarrensis TaxID=140058 RepID=A0A7X2D4F4_9PROT|nr:serine/threonine-protein kinase [Roseospira navarrensis]MQX36145.1 protein kinase [Roseospira navarrensis]
MSTDTRNGAEPAGFCPTRIGRYRVDGELGRGAMGVVYKGFDEAIDRPVALKTVRDELLDSEDGGDWKQRFQQEARAAARCSHPNIVTVYEFGEDHGLTFIAMEYVRGRELQSFMAHGVDFGLRVGLRMVMQVLAGLEAAHVAGIVHRDIKPSNVILLETGTVKVADFGIARMDSVSLSRHGTMVGTPGYMAPEQFTGGAVDGRTDLFAVGVLLYELLTGTKPFASKTVAEVMYKVLNEAPPPPRGRSEPLPPALADVMMTALARDPADRFPDATAFRAALRAVLAALPAEAAGGDGDTMVQGGGVGPDDLDGTRVMSPSLAAATSREVDGGVGAGGGDRGELDEAALQQAREHLATYLGPVASVIVRDAAQRASGIRDLYEVLAERIDDDKARAAFLRKVTRRALGVSTSTGTITGTSVGSGTHHGPAKGTQAGGGTRREPAMGSGVGSGPRSGPRSGHGSGHGSGTRAAPLTDQDRAEAREALAEHMGPIAAVLVKKAAATAASREDLFRALADHIEDAGARAGFLARARG